MLNNPASLTDPLGLQSGCGGAAHSIGPGQCEGDISGGEVRWPSFWMWDPFQLMTIPVVQAGATWVRPSQVEVNLANSPNVYLISPGFWSPSGPVVGSGMDLVGTAFMGSGPGDNGALRYQAERPASRILLQPRTAAPIQLEDDRT